MPSYSENLAKAKFNDIKYSCEKASSTISSGSEILISWLHGSLVVTSILTSTTIGSCFRKTNRIRPLQRQFLSLAHKRTSCVNLVKEAHILTGSLRTLANVSLILEKGQLTGWLLVRRATWLPGFFLQCRKYIDQSWWYLWIFLMKYAAITIF